MLRHIEMTKAGIENRLSSAEMREKKLQEEKNELQLQLQQKEREIASLKNQVDRQTNNYCQSFIKNLFYLHYISGLRNFLFSKDGIWQEFNQFFFGNEPIPNYAEKYKFVIDSISKSEELNQYFQQKHKGSLLEVIPDFCKKALL